MRHAIEEALRERGIEMSFAHFMTLFGLDREPGLPGAQLARRGMVSAQTMNAILKRLEQGGYIERRPHPESLRADSWHVTESGRFQLKRARAVGDAVFKRVLSGLSAAETAQLRDLLSRCIAAVEGKAGEVRAAAQAGRVATPRRRARVGAAR